MNDFAFVAIMIAFFASTMLLVAACRRIIGPDVQEIGTAATEDDLPQREVAA